MKQTVYVDDDGILRRLFIEDEMQFKNDRVVISIEWPHFGVNAKSQKDLETGKRSVEQVCVIHKKMKALLKNG